MRWLILSPYLPHTAVGHGGGNVTFHFVRELAREHQVTLLCFRRPGEEGREEDLAAAGVRVEWVDLPSGWSPATLWHRLSGALRAVLRDEPFLIQKYRNEEFLDRACALVDELRPHAIQVEFMALAPMALRIRQHVGRRGDALNLGDEGAPPLVLLNSHEAGALPRIRRAISQDGRVTRWGMSLDALRWARFERAALSAADLTLCVTGRDREILSSLGVDRPLFTWPLGVDVDALPQTDPADGDRLLFVGSFGHPPNIEAARLLVSRLLPSIWKEKPNLVCDIVGPNPPAWLRDLSKNEPRVVVHGFVPSLDPLYARAAVVVAPLDQGGGIKIKVLEALGRGAAMVATPLALEGIEATDGKELLIRPSTSAFASGCVELIHDPARRVELGARGRELIRARHAWPELVRQLVTEVEVRRGNRGR